MLLPVNSSLSLLGASRPGDALPSKPKKAMLVRLSSETLDVLEASIAQPQLQFEFGDNSGIYIGQTFFPMVHLPENSIHELYLRAASATKKNAPLKLHANVVGKLTVEQREIGDELRDKIRESTQDAAAQKSSRATVFMDTPPDTQTVSKKRKEPPSSMFRKPLRPSDKVKPTPVAPSSTPPGNKPALPTPPSVSQPHQGGVPLRKRLVHCLARGEKPEDELFKLLGAPDRNSSLLPEIVDLLDQLGELKPTSDKSAKIYQLKTVAWKEVRPFEWPGLSEQERIQMARRGRLTLKNLRVPESDPLWAHFQFKSSTTAAVVNIQPSASSESVRPSSSSNPSAEDKLRGSSTSEAPKRGVSSREIKEKKKMKPKSDPKVEIQMKDESQRASVRPPPESVNESRRSSDSAKEVLPARRQPPASSSRLSKPPVRQDVDKESVHPKASAGRAEKSTSQELKKARLESDIRASDSEKGSRRERTKTKERALRKGSQNDEVMDSKSKSTSKRKRIEEMDPVENAIRRAIEDDEYPSSKPSSKRKAKEDLDYIESKPLKGRATEDIVIDSRVTSSKRKPKDDNGPKSTVSKRKQVEADGDYYEPGRQKKLKSNRDSLSSTVSSWDERQRKEYALPKKPIVDSHPDDRGTSRDNAVRPASTKIGKTSPPPALKRSATADPDHRHSSKSDSPMTGSNGGKQTKSRRKSPVFTSSEDEKEEAPLNKQVPVKSSVVPPVDNAIEAHSMKRNKPPQLLSSDHASLRSRYNTKYVEYLSVMQQLVVQKGKLDGMLKSVDLDSSGTITDSEGDVELLSFEDLESLTVDYNRLHDELEGIKKLFDDKVKEEPTSD